MENSKHGLTIQIIDMRKKTHFFVDFDDDLFAVLTLPAHMSLLKLISLIFEFIVTFRAHLRNLFTLSQLVYTNTVRSHLYSSFTPTQFVCTYTVRFRLLSSYLLLGFVLVNPDYV